MPQGGVQRRRDDPGMDKTVLLGPAGSIRHRKLDFAGLDPHNRNAECAHRLLPVEGRGSDLQVIRIFRFETWHAYP
jgi:hypothetical protein